MKTNGFLDKILKDFFPQQGNWKSSCFSKSKELEKINLPCHIRDNNWIADLIIKKYNLDMKLVDVNYTFERTQLFFTFIANDRVDFRDLAKDLAKIYKTRIELRQIGPRDKAKEVGGLGPCGRPLCCSSYLYTFDNITINMAKNQNIALNPNKINGACGRLLCCLSYEDDTYSELKKDLPKVGDIINKDGISGKVISVDVIKKTYRIETKDKEIIELS